MGIKHRAYWQAKKLIGQTGFDLTRRHFYSPIPQSLPTNWDEANPMHGITMNLDTQLEWVRSNAAPLEEFMPPMQIGASYRFEYANGSFGNGDADLLYGLVRTTHPKRITELGSGHSSVVIRMALTRNSSEGATCAYEVYDPYPTDHLTGTEYEMTPMPLSAEDVPEAAFTKLSAGDILFVDTTHTVKIAGDVVRLVRDILPILAPGVLVHFHDIFLPYEYPREFFTENEYYWAEQYLLQAFLAFNTQWEIRAALHALFRDRKLELSTVIPRVAAGYPGSFWIARL
jgi:hypothetical protein